MRERGREREQSQQFRGVGRTKVVVNLTAVLDEVDVSICSAPCHIAVDIARSHTVSNE